MRHRDAGGHEAPLVGRPRGAAWRALQADGVLWEGQVLLVGAEVDLAARLILTHRRLAFARGGELVLDVPRAWLSPPPVLRPDGTIRLSIAADDAPTDPETIVLRMRDGHAAADHLLDLLTASDPGTQPPAADVPPTDPFPPRSLPPLPPLPPLWDPPPVATPTPARSPADRWDEGPLVRASTLPPAPPARASEVELPPLFPDDAGPSLDPVVRPAAPPVAIGRDRDWNLQPIKEMVPRTTRRRRRGWAIRLGGLVLLLAIAALIGSGGVPSRPSDRAADRALRAGTGGAGETTVAQVPPALITPSVSATGAAQLTAEALGVGGQLTTATATPAPTVTPTPQPEPTATPEPTASAVATTPPEPTVRAETADPTATTPPATETPVPTPTVDPTATPPPTATIIAPASHTATVATAVVAPTLVASTPTTAAPTATQPPPPSPTAEPTPAPTAAPTSAPTAGPPQRPSVGRDEVPDQALVAGPFRSTVEVAARGAPLPDFGLPASDAGEWVVLVVHVRNWSDGPAELPMSDLRLQADPTGGEVVLDSGTGVIAGILGLDPAYGSADVVPFDPGQSRRLALVYLVPADTTDLSLLVGPAALDLDRALEESAPVGELALDADVPEPDLLAAEVVEVIDGERIAVEVDGARTEVRYLGIAAPRGDACYAAEATAANAALVEGQTVWLERQRTNADSAGRLLRDAWVAGDAGRRVLVAERLVEQGVAMPDPNPPNTRFAGRLAAAAARAVEAGAGLWGACPAEEEAAKPAPVGAATGPFFAAPWRAR